jgi:hypothetical protein
MSFVEVETPLLGNHINAGHPTADQTPSVAFRCTRREARDLSEGNLDSSVNLPGQLSQARTENNHGSRSCLDPLSHDNCGRLRGGKLFA